MLNIIYINTCNTKKSYEHAREKYVKYFQIKEWIFMPKEHNSIYVMDFHKDIVTMLKITHQPDYLQNEAYAICYTHYVTLPLRKMPSSILPGLAVCLKHPMVRGILVWTWP